MTKRNQWYLTCSLFAGMWAFMGLFIWPFLFFAFVSLLMMVLPVGVDDSNPGVDRHDAAKWQDRE